MDPGPEISDLIVDYDRGTLARRPVRKADVLAQLGGWARRVAARIPESDGLLEPRAVDQLLLAAHLELQRLNEEFHLAREMRAMLGPVVAAVRRLRPDERVQVIDVGCGIGYVVRWLAAVGGLPDYVDLIGADYNAALVRAATHLAAAESLRCRFVHANALQLADGGAVFISMGVVHHFREHNLARFFAEQGRSGALALIHLDIRPSWLAPIGSYIFHQARMRVALARHDGYVSTLRAHSPAALLDAMKTGAPAFAHVIAVTPVRLMPFLSIMHAAVSLRPALIEPVLAAAPSPLRSALEGLRRPQSAP
jgi:SAM-dependent methyltransferase